MKVIHVLFWMPGLVLATFALPPAAIAQGRCAPWAALTKPLADRWREAPMWSGDAEAAGQIVIFATPDGGTWTVLLRRPDGQGCPIAAGKSWMMPAPTPAGEEG